MSIITWATIDCRRRFVKTYLGLVLHQTLLKYLRDASPSLSLWSGDQMEQEGGRLRKLNLDTPIAANAWRSHHGK